jgi:hypothetical protein
MSTPDATATYGLPARAVTQPRTTDRKEHHMTLLNDERAAPAAGDAPVYQPGAGSPHRQGGAQ